jgi:uncharacterized membrane protein
MIFLTTLQIDFNNFLQISKKFFLSYILALFSITLGFYVVNKFFNLNSNPLDNFKYITQFWLLFLLLLIPLSKKFNKFTKNITNNSHLGEIGCACTIGTKRYWFLIVLSLIVSFFSQIISLQIALLEQTYTIVLIATFLGILASFTRLRYINGSNEVANSMLYMLIALVASRITLEIFSLEIYFTGIFILFLHTTIMLIGAKLFRLDFYSVAITSLANLSSLSSVIILTTTYDKKLLNHAILITILSYIIGSFFTTLLY